MFCGSRTVSVATLVDKNATDYSTCPFFLSRLENFFGLSTPAEQYLLYGSVFVAVAASRKLFASIILNISTFFDCIHNNVKQEEKNNTQQHYSNKKKKKKMCEKKGGKKVFLVKQHINIMTSQLELVGKPNYW